MSSSVLPWSVLPSLVLPSLVLQLVGWVSVIGQRPYPNGFAEQRFHSEALVSRQGRVVVLVDRKNEAGGVMLFADS